MNPRITLTADERQTRLDHLRHAPDPPLRLRAHILLLLADGSAWATIAAGLVCSTRTIARWKDRFEQGRTEARLGKPRGAPTRFADRGAHWVVGGVTAATPRSFGFVRSRWCCAVIVLLVARQSRVAVSRATVRRWLHREELVGRRPRLVWNRCDPKRAAIVQGLRTLLGDLPENETVAFEDAVDGNLNPGHRAWGAGRPSGRGPWRPPARPASAPG